MSKKKSKKNSTKKNSFIDKFKKQDNICNICKKQVVEEDLSVDHVPPKVCPPVQDRVINKLLYEMTGDKGFKPRESQNGVWYQTICRGCNSKLGSEFDSALGDLCRNIETLINSQVQLTLPNSVTVKCRPNAVMKSILGHMLAAKTQTDEVVIDELARECILDSNLPIHPDIHIFYWIYPYEITMILRDFAMPAKRGYLNTTGFFNMIKFYPISFLITHQLPQYENLLSLHSFNQFSPQDEADIELRLNPVRRMTWPEECKGLENYLMTGRAAEDSVFSTPKPKKKNNKKTKP